VKYSFITRYKNTFPIRLMCQVLGVRRSCYYSYQWSNARRVDPEHEQILEWVKKIDVSSKNTYGSRRMKRALNALGYPVSRTKARKLMKESGVIVRHRKKYKVTTDSSHKLPVYENVLNRDFGQDELDKAYVGDITYIWTQEGWLYLAVVIDLCSRKVVGWGMSSRMHSKLVCDALTMAIWKRKSEEGLIFHSDRGSQYASKKYRKLLKLNGYIGSMSRKGNCWDNSVAESFFGTLKQELVQWKNYQSRNEAQQDILEYIVMFYNSTRLHSNLDYVNPNEFEVQMGNMKIAA